MGKAICKENASELGKKGVAAREKNKENLWAFLASGGARQYHEKLEQLANKEKLTKPEQEFMDRVEKLFPYVKPRKTDITTDGEKIPQPIINVPRNDSN